MLLKVVSFRSQPKKLEVKNKVVLFEVLSENEDRTERREPMILRFDRELIESVMEELGSTNSEVLDALLDLYSKEESYTNRALLVCRIRDRREESERVFLTKVCPIEIEDQVIENLEWGLGWTRERVVSNLLRLYRQEVLFAGELIGGGDLSFLIEMIMLFDHNELIERAVRDSGLSRDQVVLALPFLLRNEKSYADADGQQMLTTDLIRFWRWGVGTVCDTN
jgi:hypothetical protein